MSEDPIALYAAKAPAEYAAVCKVLRSEMDRALPKAASRIWHAMPVWFVGDRAVVGYKVCARHVNLLFWNGQAIGDPALKAAGKFQAAQIQFTDASQVNVRALRQWLKRAGEEIWDARSIRPASKSSGKSGVDYATVRELALALPQVIASSTLRGLAFKAHGKLLACKAIHRSAEPESLVVRVGNRERDRLIAAEPGIYYLTPHYLVHEAVLVRLAKIEAKALGALFAGARQFVAGKVAGARKPARKKKAVSVFRYL